MWIILGHADDDSWVEGIFSTKDKAQHYYDEFQKCKMNYDLKEPEEYIVDEEESCIATKVYPICIDIKTKEITKGEEKLIIKNHKDFTVYHYNPFTYINASREPRFLFYQSSISYEDAIEQLLNYVGK